MKSITQQILLSILLLSLAISAEAQCTYAEKAIDITPILPGTTIPGATVQTVDGESVEIKDLIRKKPTVLIFYRGGWCPYCNAHLAEFQTVEQQLVDIGYQILAVSPDRPEKLKESIRKHELDYTLLSDSPMNLTQAFGVAFKVDDKTVQQYQESGISLEKSSGYDHHLLPVPAVYLVNPDGLITFNYVNPTYQTRINRVY